MDAANWPLFGLRVITPRVELRLPTDDELPLIRDLAREIHGGDDPYPFASDWSSLDEPAFTEQHMQFHWNCRATVSPTKWTLPLAVIADGEFVGLQDINAEDFLTLKSVGTGSWLGRSHQGQGVGKEMRSAVLHLAFAGLGAEYAHSSARSTNARSLAVSRSLGYRENGIAAATFGSGEVAIDQRVVLDRATWLEGRRSDIEIEGLELSRRQLGLT